MKNKLSMPAPRFRGLIVAIRHVGIILMLGATSLHAFAGGNASNTTVQQIIAYSGTDVIFVKTDDAPTGRPGCATGNQHFAFSRSTDRGKRLYAALLAADISNSKISIYGTGACTVNGVTEDLNSLYSLANP